jgi:hypothetical protein
MTTLTTPFRIVRITTDTDGKEQRRVWGHYTVKSLAESVCEGLNTLGDLGPRYVVEPTGNS